MTYASFLVTYFTLRTQTELFPIIRYLNSITVCYTRRRNTKEPVNAGAAWPFSIEKSTPRLDANKSRIENAMDSLFPSG
jgi:hypothetical protein